MSSVQPDRGASADAFTREVIRNKLLASAGENASQGWLGNIIVGIVGAFLGGLLFGLLTGQRVIFGWNIGSFIVAVIGAVVLLFLLRMVRRA